MVEEKLTYTNEVGNSVEISHLSSFFLTKVDGLGAIKNIIYTQKGVSQDGVTVIEQNLDLRDISIQGSISAIDKEDILNYRRNLLTVFNPKYKGKLLYELGEFKKIIDCIVESAPTFPYTDKRYKDFIIQLMCPNPFWLDLEQPNEQIITWIGGATFKISFPVTFSTRGPNRKIINNIGDVNTPIEITFKGPALNPCITNLSTGEFIKVKRALTSDDTLIINTEYGKKRVEIENKYGVRSNAFNWIDLNSIFFNLNVGENIIEYSSDNGVEPSSIIIKYTNRYIGL